MNIRFFLIALGVLGVAHTSVVAQKTRGDDGVVKGSYISKTIVSSSKHGALVYRYKFKYPRPDELWLVNNSGLDLSYLFKYTLTDALTNKKQAVTAGTLLKNINSENAVYVKKNKAKFIGHVARLHGFKANRLYTVIRRFR